ncbi:hypothetical protein FRB98_000275 [Tulasnella sp. 332]|nr:hypothetical protein FRB98_000275 [Tulasnella sp. 332]
MTVKLIDQHVSSTHAKNAVETILKHARKKRSEAEDTELLGYAEERIALQITTKRLKADKTVRPHVIPLAHPLVDPRKEQICLITKDPQREYKDLLETKNVKFIGRVVGVTKLKGKFRGYEERRQLLKENGLFLVDERVAEMMPKLLGSMWFKAKKQPTPVNLTRADLKGHLERAISNTFMNQNAGGTISVKVATTAQTHSHVYENICKSLPEIIKHISEEWDNIQSIYLTIPGVSLPIWTCDLGSGEGARWDWMDANKKVEDAGEWGGAESDDGAEDVVVYKDNKKSAKKRKADDVTAGVSDPKPPSPSKKKKQARSSEVSSANQDPKPKPAPVPAVDESDIAPPPKVEKIKKSRRSATTSEGPSPSTSTADTPSSSTKKPKPVATTAEVDPTPVSDATLLSDTTVSAPRTKTKKRKASLANVDDVPVVSLASIALDELEVVAPSKKRKSLSMEVGVEKIVKTGKHVDEGNLAKKKRKSDVAVDAETEPPKKPTPKLKADKAKGP